jgi:VWFA-related protein
MSDSGRRRALAASAALVPLLLCAVLAEPSVQAPPSDARATPVVQVSVELVQVDASVTDRRGQRVPGLGPADFEILEDGRPQAVTHLSYVTVGGSAVEPAGAPKPAAEPVGVPVGRSLVVVVDDLAMSVEGVARVRVALRKMVEEQLEPSDRVALVLSSGGPGSTSAFSSDRRALLEAVEALHWGRGILSTASFPGTPLGGMSLGHLADAERVDIRQRMTGAALAALRFTVEALLRVPGRKALVFFAEGLAFPSADPGEVPAQRLELWPLTELANRASTVIYTIDPRGAGGGATGIPDRHGYTEAMCATLSQQPLYDLARDTGGLFLPTNDMVASVERVIEDQRGYYLLGYQPAAASFEAGRHGARHHRVSVRMKRPGLSVRSRVGYYGVADRDVTRPPAVDALMRALETPLAPGQMGVRVTALPDADAARRPFVRILLHVDGAAVTLAAREGGGSEATLEALVEARGGTGEIAGRTATGFRIPVAAGDEGRARREGFVYALTLPVRRGGVYHVRAAVRDAGSASTGSASTYADVPDYRAGRLALSGLAVGAEKSVVAPVGPAALLPRVTPAVRIASRGSSIDYALRVFGARAEGPTDQPRLATTTRLLHDGRAVYAGAETPLESAAGAGRDAIPVGGRLQLPPGLDPGSYVVEVAVRDLASSGSSGRAVRSIDFELR